MPPLRQEFSGFSAMVIRRQFTLEVILPENPQLGNRLRRRTPSAKSRKSYAYHRRLWRFEVAAYAEVLAFLKAEDFHVEVFSPPVAKAPEPAKPPPKPEFNRDRELLGVTAAAPFEVIEAAYKAQAKRHHPDMTGRDTNKVMAAFTDAYERLKVLHGKA